MKTKKLKISKNIYALMLVMFFYVGVSAQTTLEDWTLINNKNNVSIYYKVGTCGSDNVVFIRIVNSNPYNASINWSLWEGEEKNQFSLLGNQDLSGSCPDSGNRNLNTDLVDYIPSGKTIADMQSVFNIY